MSIVKSDWTEPGEERVNEKKITLRLPLILLMTNKGQTQRKQRQLLILTSPSVLVKNKYILRMSSYIEVHL